MGLFGKSKKEREKEYMNKLDVPSCLKENFELIIDDAFTIMGIGTVATGNILIGMCREGENACIYKANGDILESRITTVDVHTKERKANGCGYKTEHVGLGLRGISKEQLEKGDKVIVKNANMYGMYDKLDIENPIIRINTAFKGCSSLEKISVLPRIYHN